MTITQTKIYKYQYLINIAESIEWNFFNMPPDRFLSIPFLNPHDNHVFTSPVSAGSRYFSAYKYGLSKHPHDRAVEMLTNNPQLVDLHGLIINPNPKIAPLLEQYLDQFHFTHWPKMCRSNHKVILEFLEKHTDRIHDADWRYVSGNKHEIAIRILQNNPHKIDFNILSSNPSGFEIMKQHMDLINWWYFTGNTHPDAIRIIEQNLDRLPTGIFGMAHLNSRSDTSLSQNPSAFHILLENPHFIQFDSLLCNPSALAYIEANATRINNSNIRNLIKNPNGLMLVEKLLKQGQINEDVVIRCYSDLVMNPAFFDVDLDYQELSKKRSKIIRNELEQQAFHPSRVSKWLDYHCENGGTPEDFEM
jgi:hypothetical protein